MHAWKIALGAVLTTAWIVGCGGGGSSGDTPGDGLVLSVLAFSPEMNGMGVALDANVSATFSAPLDAATVDSSSFVLKDEGNNSVAGSIVVSGASAAFDPDANLTKNTTYTATLTTQIADTEGNFLPQAYRLRFTTVGYIPVFKTGQTKSYDQNGSVVNDGSVKDDGYYQKGVDHNYTRDDINEIVTDHVSGLMWQDDANASSVQKLWVTQANYDAGDYNNTSGDTATTYCENMTLGGYTDWRLPSETELLGITTKSFGSAIDPLFQHSAEGDYWSSTSYISSPPLAWYVYFVSGGGDYYRSKDNSGYVRCVRGGQY